MKVQELIETLQGYDPELEVGFAYDYGDYVHTQVCRTVRDVEPVVAVWSDYHSCYKIPDRDIRDEETPVEFVTLS